MNAALIVQLIIALGPPAYKLIQDLMAVWNKPELTPEEVMAFCVKSQKSYDDYIREAKQNLGKVV